MQVVVYGVLENAYKPLTVIIYVVINNQGGYTKMMGQDHKMTIK